MSHSLLLGKGLAMCYEGGEKTDHDKIIMNTFYDKTVEQ